MAAHVASRNLSLDLHIFKFGNGLFAFDPIAVKLEKLDEDEALFIETVGKLKQAQQAGHLLGWTPQRISKVEKSLSQKQMMLGQKRSLAKEHPSADRVEVMINATQECNLACEYCFVDKGRFGYKKARQRPRKLLPNTVKNLIEMLPKTLPGTREFCIHFYGGEPLLNVPAIKTAVDTVISKHDDRFTFAITTNGTVCSKEAISILRKGRFNVILSIDGPADIHDAVRHTPSGRPTHATVLKFLQQLRCEPQLFVRGSSVVHRGWSLCEATNYLTTLPVDAVKAQAVRLSAGHRLALSEKERKEYSKDLREIAKTVIADVRKGKMPKDDRFNHRVLQLLLRTRRTAFCGAGRWVLGLAADGTVLPCVLLAGQEEMSLGNINDPDAHWIDRGRTWVEKNKRRSECLNCWALPLCGGGCPAMLSVCGEDECELVRANCEMALSIYAAFLNHPEDLLVLAGLPE
jgi:uncharacterized protein